METLPHLTIAPKLTSKCIILALDYASPAGLKAGVNYTSYRSESNQDFTNKNREENTSRFQTTSGQNIDRWKIYMDREHAINNMGTLSYGASLTYANDHNTPVLSPCRHYRHGPTKYGQPLQRNTPVTYTPDSAKAWENGFHSMLP